MKGVRRFLRLGAALPLAALAACGGGSGVNSTPAPVVPTPTPTPAPTPTPTPTPTPPAIDYDTAEYQRSSGAISAKAITAYQFGATGSGVTVGVIDSGINPALAEFAGRISPASTDTAASRSMGDDDGHGTAVAAVIGAARNDSGMLGVAFDATLLIARSDTPGSCDNADGCSHPDAAITRGIDLAIANRARVVNISLGGESVDAGLRAAIGRATAAGLVIVISAGNEGEKPEGGNPDPFALVALDPVARGQVIIAGAVDASDQIASFSNRAGSGQSQYLTALGVRVRSIDQTGTGFFYSGTSFSAPVISGAAALLAQAFPNLTGAQIVKLLFDSARDLGASGDDAVYGQGVLDIARAFRPQGTLALAGAAMPVSAIGGIGSPPIGDGGQTAQIATVALNSYGRAYRVGLGSAIDTPGRAAGLSAALRLHARALGMQGGATAISLAIADRDAPGGTPLFLNPTQARYARATAGYVASRIDARTQAAMGIATSAGTIAAQLAGNAEPAFLIADAPARSLGFERTSGGAVAIRRMLGSTGLTLTAEQGDVLLYARGSARALRGDYDRYGYDRMSVGLDRRLGAFRLGLEASRLDERRTVLGARFGPALGGDGALSWFLDASASFDPGDGWTLGGTLRHGKTHARAGGALTGGARLRSAGFSLDVTKTGLFSRGDRFALRLAQPLRVTSGGFDLTLPTGYDYASLTPIYSLQRIDLAPRGRQRDAEAVYGRMLGRGWLSANLFYRQDPGNLWYAPDDMGAAMRWSVEF